MDEGLHVFVNMQQFLARRAKGGESGSKTKVRRSLLWHGMDVVMGDRRERIRNETEEMGWTLRPFLGFIHFF